VLTVFKIFIFFLFGLFLDFEDGGLYVRPKYWLTFNGLHEVMSQMLEPSIITAENLISYIIMISYGRHKRITKGHCFEPYCVLRGPDSSCNTN
jgi:hypothetical protein